MTAATQDRLFTPPREPVWCPMRNCAKRCDARTCTCPVCRCEECLQRRRIASGRAPRPQVTPLEFFSAFSAANQPRLFHTS